MGKDGKSKITVSNTTCHRLGVHMIRMRKKYPGWPGRVTYDDAVADLLDEEDKRR